MLVSEKNKKKHKKTHKPGERKKKKVENVLKVPFSWPGWMLSVGRRDKLCLVVGDVRRSGLRGGAKS